MCASVMTTTTTQQGKTIYNYQFNITLNSFLHTHTHSKYQQQQPKTAPLHENTKNKTKLFCDSVIIWCVPMN